MDAAFSSFDDARLRPQMIAAPPHSSSSAAPAARPTPAILPVPTEHDAHDLAQADRDERLSRALNATLAAFALVLLAPLFLLLAVVVKLSSRGPVFYTQTRVGVDRRWNRTHAMYDRRQQDLGGRVFTIYKFRSMTVDAETGGAVWASKNDARVTAIGRVLRKTRLDELPQFYNVLRGEMNIVGPRPERPSIFAQLRRDIPDYHLRQRAKPGITGLAQINQAYDSCLDDVKRKVEYDLEYIRRQSVAEDLRIMAKTLPVMIFRRGAN